MVERTLLGWLLIGLVAGVVGRRLMPGRDPGGLAVAILIGIAGALLAGFVAEAAGLSAASGWASSAAAAIGAAALLLGYRAMLNRRG